MCMCQIHKVPPLQLRLQAGLEPTLPFGRPDHWSIEAYVRIAQGDQSQVLTGFSPTAHIPCNLVGVMDLWSPRKETEGWSQVLYSQPVQ